MAETKPTPGPYAIKVQTQLSAYALHGDCGKLIALFPAATLDGTSMKFDEPKAEANARAWVDGIAASSTRIRSAVIAAMSGVSGTRAHYRNRSERGNR